MPIKWSGIKVNKAMDEVEQQLDLAESFLAQAEAKAREATRIAKLPDYMDQRLGRLIFTIKRRDDMKAAVKSVRETIPDGAIEAEQESLKHGSQQSLV